MVENLCSLKPAAIMKITKGSDEKLASDLTGAETSCKESECDVFPDRDWTVEEEARACRK